ncbi:ribosome biogenesis GTP-binding protein YihA/YsxC [Henriciella mobilis]|uniref:Probable GTP-binding protein EngB n=1 Tax=Henriciella mobilis TaxID=2305467 RepID=A0A399R7L6_9PROT|nr:ribosome biogenesis GTP-binding protein YihA/YsxC [Henriciella mobilis]RIJ14792.1 YihA family ribosome biogenesis GTP-binding protein [Henriciella mobilis]RIJ21748.1 YihA family ribosome biogenesis GTP-binding protein [Henriciella mobilis]RIJ26753.1 YihA family ribosome biogenesis GTP-binding protein [Henriciella mobilis]
MSETPEFDEDTLEAARILCAGPCDFVLGAASLTQLPAADRPEIAFAGRSNVGKSSLINALLNRKNLARASSEPGRTRELNYFDLGEGRLWLVDLPGFGYAKVSRSQAQEWQRLTLRYLQGRVNLRRVFLLVDSRRGLMDTDLEVMDMLDTAAVTYQVVMTKADKIKKTEAEATRAKIEKALAKRAAAHPVIRLTSAEKGWGLPELRAEILGLSA